uniref:Uncharacterized protein n=1 Tax=Megaselia scalaris TaxID=36166 RepID=T1GH08_MEGSC
MLHVSSYILGYVSVSAWGSCMNSFFFKFFIIIVFTSTLGYEFSQSFNKVANVFVIALSFMSYFIE